MNKKILKQILEDVHSFTYRKSRCKDGEHWSIDKRRCVPIPKTFESKKITPNELEEILMDYAVKIKYSAADKMLFLSTYKRDEKDMLNIVKNTGWIVKDKDNTIEPYLYWLE